MPNVMNREKTRLLKEVYANHVMRAAERDQLSLSEAADLLLQTCKEVRAEETRRLNIGRITVSNLETIHRMVAPSKRKSESWSVFTGKKLAKDAPLKRTPTPQPAMSTAMQQRLMRIDTLTEQNSLMISSISKLQDEVKRQAAAIESLQGVINTLNFTLNRRDKMPPLPWVPWGETRPVPAPTPDTWPNPPYSPFDPRITFTNGPDMSNIVTGDLKQPEQPVRG